MTLEETLGQALDGIWKWIITHPATIVGGFLVIVILFLAFTGCADEQHPPLVKTRVITMPIETPPPPSPAPAPAEPQKEDRAQKTNLGVIISVGEEYQEMANSAGWYLGLTFQENSGFQKKLFPVCDGQSLVTGRPVIMMYHWHVWEATPSDSGHRPIGCYVIDGWQM